MSKGIYYACLIGDTETKTKVPIAEAGTTNETVAQVVGMVTENAMKGSPVKRPFGSVDGDVFTYLYADGALWLAAAPEGFPMFRIMGFLETVRGQVAEKYDNDIKRTARHRSAYSEYLTGQMDFWSNDPKADKIQSVLGQVEEVKAVMVANLASVMERGERLEILHEEAQRLENAAEDFHDSARKLRCEMCKDLWCCCCCKCIGPDCCPCCDE